VGACEINLHPVAHWLNNINCCRDFVRAFGRIIFECPVIYFRVYS